MRLIGWSVIRDRTRVNLACGSMPLSFAVSIPVGVLSDKLEPVSVFADEQASGSDKLAPFEKSGVA
jgi:hypothetical protein